MASANSIVNPQNLHNGLFETLSLAIRLDSSEKRNFVHGSKASVDEKRRRSLIEDENLR